jgi:hypothetical protein
VLVALLDEGLVLGVSFTALELEVAMMREVSSTTVSDRAFEVVAALALAVVSVDVLVADASVGSSDPSPAITTSDGVSSACVLIVTTVPGAPTCDVESTPASSEDAP